MFRTLTAMMAGLVMIASLAGCSTGTSEGVSVPPEAIIIDVRSTQEYADGHLEGATLLDVTSGQLAAELPNLDPEATYFVYCRSGNRSAKAAALMADAGFTAVTDLGSLQQASQATGIAIVR